MQRNAQSSNFLRKFANFVLQQMQENAMFNSSPDDSRIPKSDGDASLSSTGPLAHEAAARFFEIVNMDIDHTSIIERLNYVVNGMEEAAQRFKYRVKQFEQSPDPERIGDLLNELLWVLPNLNFQAVVNSTIRELIRSNSK